MMLPNAKRVTLFSGHYGSGKSNLAVNYAEALKKEGFSVALADIDIVNPYFRSADSREALQSEGIRVVSLPFANTNVDLPALPSQVYGLVQQRAEHVVLDIGGDEQGAYALGRFVPYILEENDYDMLFVVNFFRPLTQTPEDCLPLMHQIASVGRIGFTGIVNNSNLGDETTAEDVLSGIEKAKALSAVSGLPLRFTSVSRTTPLPRTDVNLFPITLQPRYY